VSHHAAEKGTDQTENKGAPPSEISGSGQQATHEQATDEPGDNLVGGAVFQPRFIDPSPELV